MSTFINSNFTDSDNSNNTTNKKTVEVGKKCKGTNSLW